MATACPQNRHRQMMTSNAQRSGTLMDSASLLRKRPSRHSLLSPITSDVVALLATPWEQTGMKRRLQKVSISPAYAT